MSGDGLEVLATQGLTTVQDGGRSGWMHHGVPPGGALVPERLAAANRAVGNAWGCAALEVLGQLELQVRGPPLRLSLDGQAPVVLSEGGRLAVTATPACHVRYLAVAGGVDVPEVMGGRGTLLVAHLGGYAGRALYRGDVVAVGPGAGGIPGGERALALNPGPLRVVPGPDGALLTTGATSLLLEEEYTVTPESNRQGTRLRGTRLPLRRPASDTSRPMVRGALQVTPAGELIALGPDHPTTGGYPVVAVLIRADWGALAARCPGARVRFRAVGLEEARAAWLEVERGMRA